MPRRKKCGRHSADIPEGADDPEDAPERAEDIPVPRMIAWTARKMLRKVSG